MNLNDDYVEDYGESLWWTHVKRVNNVVAKLRIKGTKIRIHKLSCLHVQTIIKSNDVIVYVMIIGNQ